MSVQDHSRLRGAGKHSSAESAKILPLTLCLLASSTVSGLACEDKQPRFTEPMTLGGREVAPQTLEHGRDLYRMHCASCHGAEGRGDGPAAAGLKYPPRDFSKADFSFVDEGELPSHEALVERIRVGAPERGMPMWKGMRAEDLSALADYLKTFSPRWRQDSGVDA